MPLRETPWSRRLILPGRSRRLNRYRTRPRWQRTLSVISKLMMGLLLVGCSLAPGLRFGKQSDPIGSLTEGASGDARVEAYRHLAQGPVSPEQQPAVIKILKDGATQEYNVLARAAAVSGLRHYTEADATETLMTACQDRSPVVRAEACRSLKAHQSPAAASILQKLATSDPELEVRVEAASALAGIASPTTVDGLIECLKDQELAVSRCAANGLRQMTGADIKTDSYADWKSWAEGQQGQIPVQNISQGTGKRTGILDIFRR